MTNFFQKTEVSIVPYLIHRDESNWPNSEQFLPERFAKNSPKCHPFAYLPFSGGLRSCIGRNMALVEAKIVLAMLLKKFRFELVPNQNIKPLPAVTLRLSQLFVNIFPRNPNQKEI